MFVGEWFHGAHICALRRRVDLQAINVIEFDVTSFDVVKNVTLSGTSGQTLYSLALAGDNVAYFG